MIKLNESDLKNVIRGVLKEKTYDLNDDVDMLYDTYFKKDIDKINTGGIIYFNMFDKEKTHTNVLYSEICRKANEINPCVIIVNFDNNNPFNYYNPSENKISISIHKYAVDIILSDFGGDIDKAAEKVSNGDTLKNEFSEVKIKSTIHHELTHWLDETFNNNSITKELSKNRLKIAKDSRYFMGKNNINTKYYEINAQINGIIQAKRKFSDEDWNKMTFEELTNIMTTLKTIKKQLSAEEEKKWFRDLKTRMYRENLLGKNMYN